METKQYEQQKQLVPMQLVSQLLLFANHLTILSFADKNYHYNH